MNIRQRIERIDDRLRDMPKGTLTYKNIKGKMQPYLQQNIDGKSVSYYIKVDDRKDIMMQLDERLELIEEKNHLIKYLSSLKSILDKNPYLDRKVGIGWQSFEDFIDQQMLYVDKTRFIKEWWESAPQISLITRPRRFGKTLLMSTVRHFFDPQYREYSRRFEGLFIWKDEYYRKLYGTIPTIFISFASVKNYTIEGAMSSIKEEIRLAYDNYCFLEHSDRLDEKTKGLFSSRLKKLYLDSENLDAYSIHFLTECLYKHYGIKPIILLDEYDTPIIESVMEGYYDDMMRFYRAFFNSTFKNNEYLYRAIITGINKISKNSLYSDMNNICVYTMLNDGFGECFGFTENEVMDILKCQDINLMQQVKANYDGFVIGKTKDIYNPWSICNFINTGEIDSYWVNTSSNALIGELIREYPNRNKYDIELLIQGKEVIKTVNEDLAIEGIKGDEASFWALMIAVGYVKAERVECNNNYVKTDKEYRLSATNLETLCMLEHQALYSFHNATDYNTEFAEALIDGNIDKVNIIIKEILLTNVSFMDTGKSGGGKNAAENFYHGLVLGLIVVLKNRYNITSNRESGYGRYDISMVPIAEDTDALIIEFKIRDNKSEKNLEETISNAFLQIENKKYDTDVVARGIPAEKVRKVVFAFDGKDSMVVEK